MTGTITFDWPSILISVFALVFSMLAFVQTTRHRVLDRALTAHEQVVRLRNDLFRIAADAEHLKQEWRTTLSLVSNLHSEGVLSRENELDRILRAAQHLCDDLALIDTKTPCVWQGRNVEYTLRNLTLLRASADDLQSNLANNWKQLRETIGRAGL